MIIFINSKNFLFFPTKLVGRSSQCVKTFSEKNRKFHDIKIILLVIKGSWSIYELENIFCHVMFLINQVTEHQEYIFKQSQTVVDNFRAKQKPNFGRPQTIKNLQKHLQFTHPSAPTTLFFATDH